MRREAGLRDEHRYETKKRRLEKLKRENF